jgi:TPP-dependent pyruvate/acetoin dehydrogenase alpha subunit
VATKFSKETYLYWYELMQLIRQFELMAEEKYKMDGKIRGFFHAYIGQEAIAAGCMTATRPEVFLLPRTVTMVLLLQREFLLIVAWLNFMVSPQVAQRAKVAVCTSLERM